MAESKEKAAAAKSDAPATAATAAPAATTGLPRERDTSEFRFEILTPNPGFRGERCGVKFMDGRGYTNDKEVIRDLVDCGYGYHDRESHKRVAPRKTDEQLKAEQREAAAAPIEEAKK